MIDDEVETETVSGLSEKQEAFCLHYGAVGGEFYSRKEASAIQAGYPESGARTTAWKLIRNPKIQKRLDALRKEYCSAAYLTPVKVLNDLEDARIRALAKGDLMSAIRASEIVAKYLGMLVDRSQVVPEGMASEVDENLLKEAKRITELRLKQG